MYCKNCGAEISGNAKFCSECGKKTESKKHVANDGTKKRIPIFLLIAVSLLVLIITFCPVMQIREVATMYNLGGRDVGYTTMIVNAVDSYYAYEFRDIMATTRITYIFAVLVSFAILLFSYFDKYVYSFLLSLSYFLIIALCVPTFLSHMNEITKYNNIIIDFDVSMVFMFPVALCIWATIVYCFASMLFVKKHKVS